MAYLDLESGYSAPVTARSAAVDKPAEPGFSPLEWSVIALARRDPLRSLAAPSRLSRAMGSLFGRGTATSLADPRLEALRRMAVYAWRRGFALPQTEVKRFRAAGFNDAQLETLVDSVTGMSAHQGAVLA